MCKNAPETVLRIKKIQVLRGKWSESQTKAKKVQKMILSGRFGDPYRRPAERCPIWESWHKCRTFGVMHRTSPPTGTGKEAWSQKRKYWGRQLAYSAIRLAHSYINRGSAFTSGVKSYGVNIAQTNPSVIVWITVDFLFTGLWVSLRLKSDEMNIRQLATFNVQNYERLHDFRDLHNLPDTTHKSGQTSILLIQVECHIFITKSKRNKQHLSCVFLARSPNAFCLKEGYGRINKRNKKECK